MREYWRIMTKRKNFSKQTDDKRLTTPLKCIITNSWMVSRHTMFLFISTFQILGQMRLVGSSSSYKTNWSSRAKHLWLLFVDLATNLIIGIVRKMQKRNASGIQTGKKYRVLGKIKNVIYLLYIQTGLHMFIDGRQLLEIQVKRLQFVSSNRCICNFFFFVWVVVVIILDLGNM